MERNFIVTLLVFNFVVIAAIIWAVSIAFSNKSADNQILCNQLQRSEINVLHHRDSMEVFRWWIEQKNHGDLEQVYRNLTRLKQDTDGLYDQGVRREAQSNAK